MEVEGIIFLSILGAALLFWIQYLIAREFYVIALAKGHPQKKYLWLPFFLGMIGFLLVVALPDCKESTQTPPALVPQDDLPEL